MTKKQIQKECTACNEYQLNKVSENCPKHCEECISDRYFLQRNCFKHIEQINIYPDYWNDADKFEEMGGEYDLLD